MSDETIDVGYVHVLTETGGPCIDRCPHPDHDDQPCRIDAPHARHRWAPLVEDPVYPRMLHVFDGAPLRCPGVDTAAWLARRRDTDPTNG